MAFGLAEDLVDVVVSYLEANLPAKLTALDAEYTDAIVLDPTVATYKGLKSLEAIPNYPALYALSPRERLQPRAISPSAQDIEALPELSIGVVVLDQDNETLQKRLYRYARALSELLLDAWGNNSLNAWQFVTSEDWDIDMLSAEFTRESGTAFVGEVTLTVRGKRWEGNIPASAAYTPACSLNAAITTTTTTTVNFTAIGSNPIAVFDVIQIDDEQMVVCSSIAIIPPDTHRLLVGRGFAGTTAATHALGAAILFRRHLTS